MRFVFLSGFFLSAREWGGGGEKGQREKDLSTGREKSASGKNTLPQRKQVCFMVSLFTHDLKLGNM
jgi:hypothetical protein